MKTHNYKILIIQPLLAHYRRSLFERLVSSPEFDIKIIGGKQNGSIKDIHSISNKIQPSLNNRKIKIWGHTFIWQAGAISFVWKHRPDLLVLTGVDPHLVSNLVLSLLARVIGVKIIWWGHGKVDQQGKFGRLFRLFFFNRSKGIMTYGWEAKELLQQVVNRDVLLSDIRNCINYEDYGFNQIENNDKKDSGLTILFSGRINHIKRLDVLILAIAILKKRRISIQCIVIGDGECRKIHENTCTELGLSQIINFVGPQYGEECIPYFKASDLFVLPGATGLSIIHALSYGLPFITSNNLEIHNPEIEILKPGINGDFFTGFDPASLADKILEWGNKISVDRTRISKLCINSVQVGGYVPDSMGKKMVTHFSDVLK